MKFTKISSIVAGLSLLAISLVPASVSAASASLSLTGATQTNGNFAVVVYENSGDAAVTTAKIDLGFSGGVSNVNYDYSVGPFKTATPSGAHVTQGSVTGNQPVARVTFTVANPGSVTTSVGGSYLKGTSADGTAVVTHSVSGGAATFTYNAPEGGRGNDAPAPAPTTGPAATRDTSTPRAAAANGTATATAVEGAATTAATDDAAKDETKAAESTQNKDNKEDAKKDDAQAASDNNSRAGWFWLLAIAAVIAGVLTARKLLAPEADDKTKAAAAGAAAATAVAAAKKKDAKDAKFGAAKEVPEAVAAPVKKGAAKAKSAAKNKKTRK
ncbi:MAG TPA: hypothetical protein VD735_05545 [Candidatus Saccharimonadales bacterium]|nr:hypothetical protein [Candidatus Saccharimonadales bacterium]